MRGKCLCGAVEFELDEPVPMLYQCHCSLCRKQGGSSSNSATVVVTDRFRWRSDRQSVSCWRKTSGFRSDFCARCGSPVPNPLSGTDFIWVPAGLLEQERELAVVAHLFVGSRAAWDSAALAGERYETMPRLADLAALLNRGGA